MPVIGKGTWQGRWHSALGSVTIPRKHGALPAALKMLFYELSLFKVT